MSHANDELSSILDELREISRSSHLAILSQNGLSAALRSLARRSSVPTVLDIREIGRLPQPVEAAAYYVMSEALTTLASSTGRTPWAASWRCAGRTAGEPHSSSNCRLSPLGS